MLNLSLYLDKFKNIKDPLESKATLALYISEIIQTPLTEKEIIVSDKGIVSIEGSSIIKSLVFMNKEAILSKIQTCSPELEIKGVQ